MAALGPGRLLIGLLNDFLGSWPSRDPFMSLSLDGRTKRVVKSVKHQVTNEGGNSIQGGSAQGSGFSSETQH